MINISLAHIANIEGSVQRFAATFGHFEKADYRRTIELLTQGMRRNFPKSGVSAAKVAELIETFRREALAAYERRAADSPKESR
ncbi:hypothetical protein IAI18_07615 [Acetobacteraceae bacterium H6797]|nr:hypothetical protein [Acetobacteraceae bacterium H6797]